MSTFFEKLTGSHAKSSDDDAREPPIARIDTRRSAPPTRRAHETPHQSDERKPTHLKVETDERPKHTPLQESEPAPEEEGELTVDIYDKGDAIIIQSTVAGVKPEDLDVSITNDSVTIRGRRERHEEITEDRY
ncbi:MAG: Hsp20 family protein, partial [Candidatus Sungiibacteriota bacterium]